MLNCTASENVARFAMKELRECNHSNTIIVWGMMSVIVFAVMQCATIRRILYQTIPEYTPVRPSDLVLLPSCLLRSPSIKETCHVCIQDEQTVYRCPRCTHQICTLCCHRYLQSRFLLTPRISVSDAIVCPQCKISWAISC
jgi:hypothetical protein